MPTTPRKIQKQPLLNDPELKLSDKMSFFSNERLSDNVFSCCDSMSPIYLYQNVQKDYWILQSPMITAVELQLRVLGLSLWFWPKLAH